MLSKKFSLLVLPIVTMVTLQANDPFFNDPFGDDIFKEMYQMQKEMDKVFERMQHRMDQRSQRLHYPTRQSLMTNKSMRKMSLLEDKGSYYEYNTQIPENKNNQIDISIENGILHIKARVETVRKTDKDNIKMEQRSMRMFQTSETLPDDVNVSTLKSEYKNGMLVLILQKKKPTVHVQEKKKEENNTSIIKVPETSSNV